jgi:RHS repeat-associated protein
MRPPRYVNEPITSLTHPSPVKQFARPRPAARNRAYRYDAIGNRQWATEGGTVSPGIPADPAANATAVTHYTANNLNQYTSVSSVPSVTSVPSHDLNGNMTSDGLGRAFAYDEENRLVSVETETTRVAYAYDGLSRRVRRTEYTRPNPLASWGQTADRHYLYDGWNVIAEYDTGSAGILPALVCFHIWGLDLSDSEQGAGGVGGLLATRENGQIRYYTYDGNGNVSEVLDASGTVQAHYEYDPFGNLTVSTGAWANTNAWRFSTKPFDAAAGLYYYGLRFYDSTLGRWTNRDPIQERGGKNLYGFAVNDAVNQFDILGMLDETSAKNVPGFIRWWFGKFIKQKWNRIPWSEFDPNGDAYAGLASLWYSRNVPALVALCNAQAVNTSSHHEFAGTSVKTVYDSPIPWISGWTGSANIHKSGITVTRTCDSCDLSYGIELHAFDRSDFDVGKTFTAFGIEWKDDWFVWIRDHTPFGGDYYICADEYRTQNKTIVMESK